MNTNYPKNMIHSLTEREWDAIVVGGGMGGAAVSNRLANLGYDVLLVEKGAHEPATETNRAAALSMDPEFRILHGRWPTQLHASVDDQEKHISAPLGCGIGGTTLIYGAALGRLERMDFGPQTIPDGASLNWPFEYDELEPYYLEAERLFNVNGSEDPLASNTNYCLQEPPAMGDCDRHIYECMNAAQLHPYRLHTALHAVPDCDECGAKVCPKKCKGDARTRLIVPVLNSGRLTIVDRTEALQIEAGDTSVGGVRVRQGSTERIIRSRVVVLAANSLITPLILQRSANSAWPNGLGNHHDLVGRNLMFHSSDFVAVWPKSKKVRGEPSRSIAIRDLYCVDGYKLGEFQSMGNSAGYGEILTFLHQHFDGTTIGKIPLFRPLLRVPAFIGSKLFHEASMFATIVEDFPYPHNRVSFSPQSPSNLKITYQIPDDLRYRVAMMRKLLKANLSADLKLLFTNKGISLNFGHACGTCRAGEDPQTSVVDADCLVHGLENLYVADGSFMPTSGGTNPSLTIAANALRVADKIADKFASGAL